MHSRVRRRRSVTNPSREKNSAGRANDPRLPDVVAGCCAHWKSVARKGQRRRARRTLSSARSAPRLPPRPPRKVSDAQAARPMRVVAASNTNIIAARRRMAATQKMGLRRRSRHLERVVDGVKSPRAPVRIQEKRRHIDTSHTGSTARRHRTRCTKSAAARERRQLSRRRSRSPAPPGLPASRGS